MSDNPVTPRQSKRLAAAKKTEVREPAETPRRKGSSKKPPRNPLGATEMGSSAKPPRRETTKRRTSVRREPSPVPPSPPSEIELGAKSRLSRLPVNRRRSSVCGPAMTLEDLAKAIPTDVPHEQQMEYLVMLGTKYALQHGNTGDPANWKAYDRKVLNNQKILASDLKKQENHQKFCQGNRDASGEKVLSAKEDAEKYVKANNAEKERWKKLLANAKEGAVQSKNKFLAEEERQLNNKRSEGYESLRAEVAKECEEERAATAKVIQQFEENVAKWNGMMDALDREAKRLDAQCEAADAKLERYYARYEENNQQDTPRTAAAKIKK